MAAFKLPSLSLKKRRRQLSLPEFRWNSISLKEELGRGTFGTVYLAKCTGEEQCVVIKKLKWSQCFKWKSCSREQLDDKIKTSDALIWKARVENKRCLKVLNLTKNMHACAQLNFTQQFIIPYLTLCHSRLSFCVVFHPKKPLTRWRLGIGSC